MKYYFILTCCSSFKRTKEFKGLTEPKARQAKEEASLKGFFYRVRKYESVFRITTNQKAVQCNHDLVTINLVAILQKTIFQFTT